MENYSAINWDSESKDFNKEINDATKIRQFVDNYNNTHKNDPKFIPLKFIAFFHLNIIDANPDILKYPDVILIGKTFWDETNVKQESGKYIELIQDFGKTPGILLGEKKSIQGTRIKTSNTKNEVKSNFESITSAPGFKLNVVGFYYDTDKVDSLIYALSELR